MSNILKYKNYYTKIEFSSEDNLLFGKIEGIADLISFETDNASEVENAFHEAVDDYIEFCNQVGKEPNKSYSGSFNIRISPELHKFLTDVSFEKSQSLNQTVEQAIECYMTSYKQPKINNFIMSLFERNVPQNENVWESNITKKYYSNYLLARN